MSNLIRSELLKVRTTNMWWIFTLVVVLTTGLAVWFNASEASYLLNQDPPSLENSGLSAEEIRQIQAEQALQSNEKAIAADIFTSGQYFASLFVMIIAILLVTNEYHHQTATATFLTTPNRLAVVKAKMVTATMFAVGIWVITTVISLGVGVLFYQSEKMGNHLGDWAVQRAILFNLLVYVLWAILGVGFGALIRSQIGATITGAVLYTIGTQVVETIFGFVRFGLIKHDWVLTLKVLVPPEAARIFVAPVKTFVESPPYWVGGLVLLGYGLLSAAIGTWFMRRRDIS